MLLTALCAVALPATASAQATRTWVSGVGDDANPCSRTAPCKTFAGAISKTASNGEINVLDGGGFGGVTITKSITIRAVGATAGVLVSGTNAIVINAATSDDVTLDGLDINGLGTSLNAIRVLQAGDVRIENTHIFGFGRNAIDMEPANMNAKLYVKNVVANDNVGAGLMAAPQQTGRARVVVRGSEFDYNECGLVASSFPIDPAFNFGVRCGTLASAANTQVSTIRAFGNSIAENPRGVFANGSEADITLGANEVTGSNLGLSVASSGGIESFGDNHVVGNNTNGDPNSTIATK